MTEPKNIWLVDAEGRKARVTPDEVDTWTPRGWAKTSEPEAADMVWLQHHETGGKQLFAHDVVEQWQALGWEPAAPPPPVDLTKDLQLVDVKDEAADTKPTKSTKAASGGSNKES